MTADGHLKRKTLNFGIQRGFQVRMLARLMLVLLFCLLSTSLVFYLFAHREVGESYRLFHVRADNFLDFLLPVVLGAFSLGVLLGGVVALFFPGRIAGPLHRMERELERVGDGDLTVLINLRKRDELHSLANGINRMTRRLSGRILALKQMLEQANAMLQPEGNPGPDLAALRKLHEDLYGEIGRFRLNRE